MHVVIRSLRDGDSMAALTELLHRAYADLAAMGLRYLATHQDEATTRRRCAEGDCFIAEMGGAIVGTLTLMYHNPSKPSASAWYNRPDVARFGQFGVEPALQRRGVGMKLLQAVERRAIERGVAELALDTAEPATRLIQWYARLGYRFIEHVQWDVTNYRSVIMSKTLRAR